MLQMASFPPDASEVGQWFADHEREWTTGEAYRFAILLGGTMIGLVDIDNVDATEGTLGYWLDGTAWGRGYGSEAAGAAVRFAFETLRLSRLKAGHAFDNEASGRVLRKLGFREVDAVQRLSQSRRENVVQRRYVLATEPDEISGFLPD